MKTKRRYFIKVSGSVILTAFFNSKLKAAALANEVIRQSSKFKERIISIVIELKAESTNLVKKIMDGKKYIYDPYTHYPYDGGIKDQKTGYQLFFHAHRENEYGHFHTFATNKKGDLVHLILISMNEEGKPIGLATVNRWVTGDKYVKAEVLKNMAENWFVDPTLFKVVTLNFGAAADGETLTIEYTLKEDTGTANSANLSLAAVTLN